MPVGYHMKYSIQFSQDDIAYNLNNVGKLLFEKNESLLSVDIYVDKIDIAFKKRVLIKNIVGMITPHENFHDNTLNIQPQKKLKKNNTSEQPIERFERPHIVEQPPQLENVIIFFHNGQYEKRDAISYTLLCMLQSMATSSKTRRHHFNMIQAKKKLLLAFEDIADDFRCGCNRCNCEEIMQLYGPNKLSPDRKNDKIGYCEDNQKITFVVMPHNTPIKPDSVEIKTESGQKWFTILASSMKVSTKRRIAKLRKKSKKTDFEKEQIKRYDDDERNTQKSNQHYVILLKLKRLEQKDLCSKCKQEMYFGNDDQIVEYSNRANKASPDRLNNNNIFYDADNFTLVCCACNYSENWGGRTYFANKAEIAPINFTPNLLKQCKEWLIPKN